MRRLLLPAFALLLGLLALLGALYWAGLTFSEAVPGGGDFLLLWGGLRAYYFERVNPHSVQVAEQVAAWTGATSPRLAVPFPWLLLASPLVLIPDPLAARAAGLLILWLAGLALVVLSGALTGWTARGSMLALAFLCALIWFPSAVGWVQGGLATLGLVFLLGGLLALRARSDELAGALFFLALARPSFALPLLAFALFDSVRQRRWRVLAGLLMPAVVLSGVATLVFPGWLLEFGRAALANARAFDSWTVRVALESRWPGYGSGVSLALIAVLLLTLAVEWGGARPPDSRRWVWVACLTLAATPLVGLPVTPDALIVVWPAAVLIADVGAERWPRAARWLSPLFWIALLAGSWGLAWRAAEVPAWLLLLPALAVLGLYWMRWWAVRPPRTWLDRVSAGRF